MFVSFNLYKGCWGLQFDKYEWAEVGVFGSFVLLTSPFFFPGTSFGGTNMTDPVSDIAFTPAVKSAQQKRGSRDNYQRMEQGSGWQHVVTPELAAFISQRDTFYLGTASDNGQPYIQHRGGPVGFLKVVDENRLGFADYSGNRQYISVGNLDENNKAFIFLMDYPNRRRIKLWGTAEVVESDPNLLDRLADDDGGPPERAMLFHIEAWDVNCPKYITPRWTESELAPTIEILKSRVAELERENRELRSRGSRAGSS